MIESFKHRGLKRYWNTGQSQHINPEWEMRLNVLLTVLNDAVRLQDLNQPGFYFHSLRGSNPSRYSLRVTGNWRMTFEWDEMSSAVTRVDLEDYH